MKFAASRAGTLIAAGSVYTAKLAASPVDATFVNIWDKDT